MADAIQHVQVTIRGQVQGVMYRSWTRQTALQLGLDGWVRNRRDGSVEAVFRGQAEAVDSMVGLCWHGPPLARVDDVVISDSDEEPPVPGFFPKPTV